MFINKLLVPPSVLAVPSTVVDMTGVASQTAFPLPVWSPIHSAEDNYAHLAPSRADWRGNPVGALWRLCVAKVARPKLQRHEKEYEKEYRQVCEVYNNRVCNFRDLVLRQRRQFSMIRGEYTTRYYAETWGLLADLRKKLESVFENLHYEAIFPRPKNIVSQSPDSLLKEIEALELDFDYKNPWFRRRIDFLDDWLNYATKRIGWMQNQNTFSPEVAEEMERLRIADPLLFAHEVWARLCDHPDGFEMGGFGPHPSLDRWAGRYGSVAYSPPGFDALGLKSF